YRMQVSGFLRQHNFETYHNLYNPMLQLFVDTFMNPSVIWFYGEYEADLIEQYHPFPQIPDNIVTRSIVEGEIAYLRIDSFLADPEYDDLKILPFLQSIQDYDHLIIDIQGNLGGIGDYFNALVLRRLISAPVEVGGFEFFSSGDVASRWMHAYVDTSQLILEAQSPFHWNELMYITITPIDEFIAQRDMPYFNPDDLERLAYAVSTRSTIWPSFDRVGFDGKIWLLIDENSASASALAAATALYTGFATVVGENTSGVMGSTHAYASLPNTGLLWRMDIGYVTDLYGRSLEVYGISPQIKNRPNMTALETVLAIIAEAKEEAKENDTESYDVEMNNQDEPPTSPLPQ
ncbi:MAG: S41 family peptidase, partial [Defluviitaleaceae bacterium]|nr:S41 family peptidase [Defluviitaleaceae bacterium]